MPELTPISRQSDTATARAHCYAPHARLEVVIDSLEQFVEEARRVIHDNDVDRLRQLLIETPALLSWKGPACDKGGLLGMATDAYGDAGDAQREQWFTRPACAELLIDAGAIVSPSVSEGILESRAQGLLQLFERKGLLPRTLPFLAALGDTDAVRSALDAQAPDLGAVNEAFQSACRFGHDAIAAFLLDHAITRDPHLGSRIDSGVGRKSFISEFRRDARRPVTDGLWNTFVMDQAVGLAHEGDVPGLIRTMQREPWLLDDGHVSFQSDLIASAAFGGQEAVITTLLEREPAIARRRPPPPTQAFEHAFTYANTHVIPALTRVWPLPDDLPHAAGMGDSSRVQRWFDDLGRPALGDPARHFPATSPHPREPQWGPIGEQEVLDTALAWAVINRHFEVADHLLAHGADINTRWNSHEPASILHHLVFLPDAGPSMQYLLDRGIDLTLRDYRWNSTAEGWARYAKGDTPLADWIAGSR